jgi:hypothetical protein
MMHLGIPETVNRNRTFAALFVFQKDECEIAMQSLTAD